MITLYYGFKWYLRFQVENESTFNIKCHLELFLQVWVPFPCHQWIDDNSSRKYLT
jgi:hypothetical protein